ncbi:hypothetical protein COV93_00145 [Candidatus Woesearchaeota archaeon CG11_big_fil_rev_8_21_14_0_20_43_8]|nr:MAG: hypothetical protein COV93_00145 [Candidatus Woesearchaeota archaeon CG11_big_fil_rev_8_21_14_0_20_43_8]PIO06942.1 MAG: hypothetical protein COT47_02135 [Candidatus Woesearchaeota archaeon CG08_land_8_20_14_0_20_43_7]
MGLKKISNRRKGSLSLSINAIVVLILAITMLGLGLGFMKKMFGSTTKQFEDVADGMKEEMIKNLQGSTERVAMNRYDMNIKKGDEKEIYFAIKNDIGTSGAQTQFNIVIACYGSIQPIAIPRDQITFSTLPSKSIDMEEISVMKAVIKASSNSLITTYSCKVAVCDSVAGTPLIDDDSNGNQGDGTVSGCGTSAPYAQKDFFINVKSS